MTRGKRKYLYYVLLSIISVWALVTSYISRFAVGTEEINDSYLIPTILFFEILLAVIAIIDKEQSFKFEDIVAIFIGYLIVLLYYQINLSYCTLINIIIKGTLRFLSIFKYV